jgi:hypothetical protein
MRLLTKASIVGASVLGLLGVGGLGTFIYASTVAEHNVQTLATEAVVFDVQQGSMYRMNEIGALSDFKVNPVSALANAKQSQGIPQLVSQLKATPDLSTKLNIAQSMKNTHLSQLQKFATQIFTSDGPYMTNERRMFSNIVANDDTPTAVQVDGGIRDLNWSSVNVNELAGTAILSGQGDAWASFARWTNGKYVTTTPTSTMNFTVYLKQVNGQWKVDNVVREFAPGSEP